MGQYQTKNNVPSTQVSLKLMREPLSLPTRRLSTEEMLEIDQILNNVIIDGLSLQPIEKRGKQIQLLISSEPQDAGTVTENCIDRKIRVSCISLKDGHRISLHTGLPFYIAYSDLGGGRRHYGEENGDITFDVRNLPTKEGKFTLRVLTELGPL